MDLEEKVNGYFEKFGAAAVNLAMERHQLSDRKRGFFTIRFVSKDPKEERELTEQMDQLTEKIKQIDNRLELLGVNSKMRIQIIKDIKKAYPNGSWGSGFEED